MNKATHIEVGYGCDEQDGVKNEKQNGPVNPTSNHSCAGGCGRDTNHCGVVVVVVTVSNDCSSSHYYSFIYLLLLLSSREPAEKDASGESVVTVDWYCTFRR